MAAPTQYAAPTGQIDHTVGSAPYTDVPATTTNPTQVNTAPTAPNADPNAPSYAQAQQPIDNTQSGAIVQHTGDQNTTQQTGTNEKGTHEHAHGHGHGHAAGGVGEKNFSHGLFDCFSDVELCLCGTFLPCVVYGKIAHRLRDPSLTDYNEVNKDCLTWYGLTWACGLQWIVTMTQRATIRQNHGFHGDEATDCLLSYCCGCCVLIQEEKELRQPLVGGAQPAPSGYSGNQAQAGGMEYKA